MIRAVPTGDLGLDVLLGGGWRLVERLPPRLSTAVVVRGGPGTGKTLLALQVALTLADALDGDVVVGCVELLPSEYLAQVQSARPDIARERVVVLPGPTSTSTSTSTPARPRIFCGLLTDLDPDSPDLVASLEALERDAVAAGAKPAVFVVDSLIEGYGIGESAPRASADAIMKFAAQEGRGLVLCEETRTEKPSTWVFAADTVLELGVASRERGRWIEVRKHRYGASVSGRHELEIRAQGTPMAYPQSHAWVADSSRGVLDAYRGVTSKPRGALLLHWHASLRPDDENRGLGPLSENAFALVTSPEAGIARTLAVGLLPAPRPDVSPTDLWIGLEPLILEGSAADGDSLHIRRVPTMHGASRALRMMIEGAFLAMIRQEEKTGLRFRRIVLGDLGLVTASADSLDWVEAIRVFVGLVTTSGAGTPVLAFEGLASADERSTASRVLAGHADLHIVAETPSGSSTRTVATSTNRHQRAQVRLTWRTRVDAIVLEGELAIFDQVPPAPT